MDGNTRGGGHSEEIKNYNLGRTLGHGSFGKVKLAEHKLTGHKVAIKILNRRQMETMEMEDKANREIKILRLFIDFIHPHIIRVYEVIDTPKDIFVVMEYCKNGELLDYIVEKGRLQEDDARRIFQQSRADPRAIMIAVLKALKELNVRWKKNGDYNMKCRWFPRFPGVSDILLYANHNFVDDSTIMDNDDANRRLPAVIKFEIQVCNTFYYYRIFWQLKKRGIFYSMSPSQWDHKKYNVFAGDNIFDS